MAIDNLPCDVVNSKRSSSNLSLSTLLTVKRISTAASLPGEEGSDFHDSSRACFFSSAPGDLRIPATPKRSSPTRKGRKVERNRATTNFDFMALLRGNGVFNSLRASLIARPLDWV